MTSNDTNIYIEKGNLKIIWSDKSDRLHLWMKNNIALNHK